MQSDSDNVVRPAAVEPVSLESGNRIASWIRRHRLRAVLLYLSCLAVLFAVPLFHWVTFAIQSDLNSHILLVPVATAYLLRLRRSTLPVNGPASPGIAVLFGFLSLGPLAATLALPSGTDVSNRLALYSAGLLCLVLAGAFLILGSRWVSAASFPLAFLAFMIPLPEPAVNWLENVYMLASADATAMYFRLAGVPFFRQETVFQLPGMALRVAQECSGIHSSWVLFITSILATQLLRSRWHRLFLVAFVIPLGILRNGFRILVIGLLCIHVGPHMIDSPIHHRGGPIFFALSLIPFTLLLCWFRYREIRAAAPRKPMP